eukprot:2957893-Rhodomonas_salina.3
MGAEVCKPCCDNRHVSGANFSEEVKSRVQLPLHAAAMRGSADGIAEEIERGANVDAQDEMGRTALHIASHQGFLDAVTELVKHGATTSIKTRHGASTAQQLAERNGREEVAEFLAQVDAVEKWCEDRAEQGNLDPLDLLASFQKPARSDSSGRREPA